MGQPVFSAILVAFLLLFSPAAQAQFSFPISAASPRTGVASFAELNSGPAGADGFVHRDGGHFATDAGPIRFWGVNLCFGANFPEPADARMLATHLSSLAVNCVRIHHQETQYSPSGLYDRNTRRLDPAQVDKLDYLLAQLHAHGIYANLNLHVGRSVARELGLPPLGSGHSASGDKHLLHFFPPVEEAFWQYCRDYLGHTNPHRKLRRADDPGIAMIEVLNENRFHLDGSRHLVAAPEPYRSEILQQWNAWLKERYTSDEALHAAWEDRTGTPAGDPLVTSGSWLKARQGSILRDGWAFGDNSGQSPASVTFPEKGTIRIASKSDTRCDQAWHQQLNHEGLTIKKGRIHTLRFEARAAAPRTIQFNLATLEGGWKSLGLSDHAKLTTDWNSFTVRFTATADSKVGKFAFDLGDSAAPVEIRALELRPGASWMILPRSQSITDASVGIPDGGWSPAARAAFVEFMADTERTFYRKTRALLKELGVRVPVTTTQVNYQGAAMAAELSDYTDMHSYWHHPLFPGRNWDGNNWTIGHDPLESRPYADKWPRNNPLMRASWRVHGMPFTYSEWNVGEPSFPSAGAVPLMSLLGSLQDWSGVFFFDYDSSSRDLSRNKITGYFSLNAQSAKLGLLGPFGALYRTGALAPLTDVHASSPDAHLGSGVHSFRKRIGIDITMTSPPESDPPGEAELLKSHPPLLVNPARTARWDARIPDKAIITIDLPTVRALWGRIGGASVQLGSWKFAVGDLPGRYGIIIAQSRDGLPLEQSKAILITSVSHAENQGFPWRDKERSRGGADWGKGPVQVWNVPFILTLPRNQTAKSMHALSPTGKRLSSIAGPASFQITQGADTIWFELVP